LFRYLGEAIGKPLKVPTQLLNDLGTEEISAQLNIRHQRSANQRFLEGSVHGVNRDSSGSGKGRSTLGGAAGTTITADSPNVSSRAAAPTETALV